LASQKDTSATATSEYVVERLEYEKVTLDQALVQKMVDSSCWFRKRMEPRAFLRVRLGFIPRIG
jgi:hypothetical protein